MAVFQSEEELYEILGGFFNEIKFDEAIGSAIAASKIIIQWEYSEPHAKVTIDATGTDPEGGYFQVILGPTDIQPEVFMTMKGDVAHLFWMGKVNLLSALSRRQIVAKGPIPKTLKLLPAIAPSYEKYPRYLEAHGRSDLIGK